MVAISQSGETADTLQAIRHARQQRSKVLAICNTNGSTIPRESDAVIYTHAGPEIGVASTKGFMTQMVAAYLLGLYLAQVRGTSYADEIARVVAELGDMPGHVQRLLDSADDLYALAEELQDTRSVLFLGRHVGFPIALEGALKLKELAYLHAEGFAAGELKHGPIALIEPGLPVFCVVPPKRPRPAPRQDGERDPGDPGARCPHDRAGRGRRHRDRGVRRHDHPAAAGLDAAPAGAGRRTRSSCSRASSRRGWATTSTSRATWPSPSPSSRAGRWRSWASGSTSSTSRASTTRCGVRRGMVERLFTPAEATRPPASLAARFAAKEALAKALGAPGNLEWHDAEVVSESSGRPRFTLRGTVAARAAELGATSVHLSLSHDAGIASAVVVLEG